jgi:NAD(P)-dependent dehydrogenase (short-subunit alcohol dehydrogenase family)/uncharacterized OB-fold protein
MTPRPPPIRSRAALGLTAAAAVGRFELQVCRSCGAVQYPPREACHRCLSSALEWRLQPGGAELLSETTLRHSHDEFFRGRLPIRLGLVRLDSGPTAVVFLDDGVAAAPERVRVDVRLDRAGQGILVAFAEGAAMTQTSVAGVHKGEHAVTGGKLLREMSCDPRGRKVLVTDVGSSLGVELARALLDAGAEVVWAGCGPASATRGDLGELLGAFKQVRPVSLDVTSDESVQGAADQMASQVDILINNAESCGPGVVAAPNAPAALEGAAVARRPDLGSAREEMDTNYFGLLRLARAFVPAMQARGASVATAANAPMMAWVDLLSISALTGVSTQSTFAASKAAACSFAQSLRAEMLPTGIRVINVFPGPDMVPIALAQSIVKALQDGIEDLFPGEIAQDWLTQWRNNPKGLERELTPDLAAAVTCPTHEGVLIGRDAE